MRSNGTEAFATRLSCEEAELILEAVEQTGLSRSELLARGFRYYLEENPDEIPAFHPDELGPLSHLGILPPVPESDWNGIEER
jgi:hypothetical protein